MDKVYMLPFQNDKNWWYRDISNDARNRAKLRMLADSFAAKALVASTATVVIPESSVNSNLNLLIPKIKDIEVKNDPQTMESQYDKEGRFQKPTVIVTFTDGTVEKAAASEDDSFSLEQGISICFTKKLLSLLTTDNGSSVYNKMLHNAMKLYKAKQKEIAEKQELEQSRKEYLEKLAAKRAKRKAKKREREISVRAEAYARALRMVKREETM